MYIYIYTYISKLKKHWTVLTMIQYFGHHHQTFHLFWPRHSLHQKSRCFYKPRISWHTQLLWQNLIGTMIEHNNFQKRYMYFYLPHPQSSALTSLMASKTNPKAKRAIFMLNIILMNSYFVLWVTEIKVIQSLLILAFL